MARIGSHARPWRAMVTAWLLAAACGDVSVEEPDGGGGSIADAGPGAFSLAVAPGRAFIRQGGSAEFEVTIAREDGFAGPVEVGAGRLPDGVTADPLTIPAGESSGILILRAALESPQGAVDIDVTGEAGKLSAGSPIHLLVAGVPGSLDLSFAVDGTFTFQVGGPTSGRGIAVLPDGKIVVTGIAQDKALVMRLDPTGALDPGFGAGGAVSIGVGPSSRGLAIAAQGDRIVVAGSAGETESDLALFGFDDDGRLDDTFAIGGITIEDIGAGVGELRQLLVDQAGKLVAVGVLSDGAKDFSPSHLLRYSADGISADIPGDNFPPRAEAALLLPDGRILAAGGERGDYWLSRVRDDGILDLDFSADGVVATDFDGGFDVAFGLVAAAGARILSVGVTHPFGGGGPRLSLARHEFDGAIDPTFGTFGRVLTDISFDTRAFGAAILDPNGRTLVVGQFPDVPNSHLAIVRLLPDGTPDPDFADAGAAAITFAPARGSRTGAHGLAVDADGRIIVSGEIGPDGEQSLAIARLWP